jgi:mRNA interferase HigB
MVACMRVISRKALRDFCQQNRRPDSEVAEKELSAWYFEAKNANWNSPSDLKEKYRSASILKGGRCVFNICGNKYRLIVKINYNVQIIYIRWVGTHSDYDNINAEEV